MDKGSSANELRFFSNSPFFFRNINLYIVQKISHFMNLSKVFAHPLLIL